MPHRLSLPTSKAPRRARAIAWAVLCWLLVLSATANAGDSTELVPLTELGQGKYQDFEGGLYPGGANKRPAWHELEGLALAAEVQPLDAEGRPDARGKIVLLSIGMSNTTQEFSTFQRLAAEKPEKDPRVLLVDGAQGGMTAQVIQTADDNGQGAKFWTAVDQRLAVAGATREQVQATWIKEADPGPNEGFPRYARKLEEELQRIVQLMHGRFPRLKLAYLSSRIYAGYATTRLNPEPYAYESGFSVKWLVERQIKGDAELSYDPDKGRVPWLSWGPYLWAGETPRADGLRYEQGDFGGDGTHPSPAGRLKVAQQLWDFFSTDPTSRHWFLGR